MAMTSRLLQLLPKRIYKSNVSCVRTRFRRADTPAPITELRPYKSPITDREYFPGEFSVEPIKGRIADKKPMKMFLEAGKEYMWCTCGHSKSQPVCDGTHKRLDGSEFTKKSALFRPHVFTVSKSDDYYLCCCKQTNNRPFCDGAHRNPDIQEKIR